MTFKILWYNTSLKYLTNLYNLLDYYNNFCFVSCLCFLKIHAKRTNNMLSIAFMNIFFIHFYSNKLWWF